MAINNSKKVSMRTLKILSIAVFVYFLGACGDAESPVTESTAAEVQENTLDTGKPNPHTVRGMKNAMDDAKGVEDLLQQRHDEQRKEIDSL